MSYLQRLATSVSGLTERPGAVNVALPSRFAPTVATLDRRSLHADDADSGRGSEQGAHHLVTISEARTRASATSGAPTSDLSFSLGAHAGGRDDGGSVSQMQGADVPLPAGTAATPSLQALAGLAAASDSAHSVVSSASLADGPRPLQHAAVSPPQRPLRDLAVASRTPEPRSTPPVIQVTIDRIDVHAPAAPASRGAPHPQRAMPWSSVSLNDYLRGRRNDGGGT
jgi:hypothetical protein